MSARISPSLREKSSRLHRKIQARTPISAHIRYIMATQTTTRKRKSADGTTESVKKVRTVKSAEQPTPLKSALKKTKTRSTKTAGEETPAPVVEEVETLPPPTQEPITTDLTTDQTAALLAGFSSDEDEASEDEAGIAVSKLPKAPSSAAILKLKETAASRDTETTPGVVYIGRIPHGFYEHQMRAYFSQFGDITNLRLMRSSKTGNSQHHGFIEFASAAVAEIVCKTMDKYLLFGHILQVKRVPAEQVNEKMWRRSGRRARHPAPRNKLEGSQLRRGATREVWEARVEREEKKRLQKAEKLKELGYEFDMPEIKAVSEVPVKQKAIEGVDGIDAAAVEEGVAVEENITTQNGSTTQEVVTKKKRPASGKTEVKKVVKKVKA